jgi:tetrahydromethanopterin S-methyltransferase subunit H
MITKVENIPDEQLDMIRKGIATELINYAKEMSDSTGLPLLFDTDMEEYAKR